MQFTDARLVANEVGACVATGCVDGPLDESVTPLAALISLGDETATDELDNWNYDPAQLDTDPTSLLLLVSTSQTNDCRLLIEEVERRGTNVEIQTRLSDDSCDTGTVGVSFVFAMTTDDPIDMVLVNERQAVWVGDN